MPKPVTTVTCTAWIRPTYGCSLVGPIRSTVRLRQRVQISGFLKRLDASFFERLAGFTGRCRVGRNPRKIQVSPPIPSRNGARSLVTNKGTSVTSTYAASAPIRGAISRHLPDLPTAP